MSNTNHSFRCDKINSDLNNKLRDLKREYDISNNFDLLSFLVDNHIVLKKETRDKINKLCDEKDHKLQDLLSKPIERYINKTLKSYGLVKSPHKKTVEADQQIYVIIEDIIQYYNDKPSNERKFLSPSVVIKFISKYDEKYKAKHIAVIRRGLLQNHKIVEEYHTNNQLDETSNLYNRKNKSAE